MDSPSERHWSPRLWEGMDYFAWLRLLAAGHGRVGLSQLYLAPIINAVSFTNTLFRWMQEARYRKKIDAIHLDPPPLFVLGHWRTGTTLLHELLLLDDRHTGPTTLHCFEPCHCMLSERLFRERLAFLLPDKRPMDNMAFGWDKPQEDEFALALLGQPSTYTEIAWPNRDFSEPWTKWQVSPLDLSSLSPRQLQGWKRTFVQFLKMVQFLDNRGRSVQRRLILKSPPHTARIPVLLELFPQAKFVYLKRNPHVLYSSTLNLWTAFARKHGLQTPKRPDLLEAKVLREFRILIDRYDATKHLIPPGNLVEVKYEDLAADIVAGTRSIYEGLGLSDWPREKIEESARHRKDYSPNKYVIDDAIRDKVNEHWGDIVQRWGYSSSPPS